MNPKIWWHRATHARLPRLDWRILVGTGAAVCGAGFFALAGALGLGAHWYKQQSNAAFQDLPVKGSGMVDIQRGGGEIFALSANGVVTDLHSANGKPSTTRPLKVPGAKLLVTSYWVLAADRAGRVHRLRLTLEPAGRLRLHLGSEPAWAAGPSGVWAWDRDRWRLLRLGPQRLRELQAIRTGARVTAVAVSPNRVMAVQAGRQHAILYASSNTGRYRRLRNIAVAERVVAVTWGAGHFWVLTGGASRVIQYDRDGNQVGKPLRVGRDSTSIIVNKGSVWTTSAATESMWQTGASSRRRQGRPIPLPDGPAAVAGDSLAVYAAAQDRGVVTRLDLAKLKIIRERTSANPLRAFLGKRRSSLAALLLIVAMSLCMVLWRMQRLKDPESDLPPAYDKEVRVLASWLPDAAQIAGGVPVAFRRQLDRPQIRTKLALQGLEIAVHGSQASWTTDYDADAAGQLVREICREHTPRRDPGWVPSRGRILPRRRDGNGVTDADLPTRLVDCADRSALVWLEQTECEVDVLPDGHQCWTTATMLARKWRKTYRVLLPEAAQLRFIIPPEQVWPSAVLEPGHHRMLIDLIGYITHGPSGTFSFKLIAAFWCVARRDVAARLAPLDPRPAPEPERLYPDLVELLSPTDPDRRKRKRRARLALPQAPPPPAEDEAVAGE